MLDLGNLVAILAGGLLVAAAATTDLGKVREWRAKRDVDACFSTMAGVCLKEDRRGPVEWISARER